MFYARKDWKEDGESHGQEGKLQGKAKEGDEEMERMPVKSSVIVAKGYNALTNEMELEFKNGAVGSFREVSPSDSKWFDEQQSAGKAMWSFHRAGYGFTKGEK